MTVDMIKTIITKGVFVILSCSGPIVGTGLLVGFSIALFQAVTQIQEQTLTFVPKMITVLLMISIIFPWIGNMVISLAKDLWQNIPMYGLYGA